jgi:DNA-directed RNA polymerase subunit omega
MARVTVEDCVMVVPNRFELCLVASNRAKSILSGAGTNFDRKEKPSVIALREIGDGAVDVDKIRTNIVGAVKNRGTAEYNDLLTTNSTILEVSQEVENQSVYLKGNAFIEDNIQIDD